MTAVTYNPPRDCVRLDTADERVLALADRLWDRGPAATSDVGPIAIRVAVRPGPGPELLAERDVVWTHRDDAYTVSLGTLLEVRIGLREATIEAAVTEGFLAKAPALAARTLLEAPAAVLLSRRAFTVLHAAAVVGPRGAVVIRGASGAGKSTLTGAAWRAGFDVLADESLMVAREDHDDLAACVRDLTLLPDAARLLSLDDAEVAFSGGEEKRRIDLFRSSAPSCRRSRRVATLLLGERAPGPACLTPLLGPAFRDAFRRGEIPEERLGGDPDRVSQSWAAKNSYRLNGVIDLTGAVALLKFFLN